MSLECSYYTQNSLNLQRLHGLLLLMRSRAGYRPLQADDDAKVGLVLDWLPTDRENLKTGLRYI